MFISGSGWSRLINSIKAGKTLFEKLQLRIFSLKNKKKIEKRYDTLPTKINDPVIPTEYHVGKFRTKIISIQRQIKATQISEKIVRQFVRS